MSTPAISTVRASFPQAHITMVASTYNRVAIERNTDVNALRALPPGVKPGAFAASYRGNVDLAIALAPRATDFAIVGATRARIRLGYTYARRYFARLTYRRYLTQLALSQADPRLSDVDRQRQVRHEVEELLDLVALAGATKRIEDLRIDVSAPDRAAVAHLPAGALTFHLAQNWLRAGSSLDNTIALIGELRRFGLPIVVTHAPEHQAAADAIARAGVADAIAGNLTFHEWAATFERGRCVVTVDTAATHVASAVHRPAVVAFEDRFFALSSQEWAPYRVPHAIVRKPADASAESLARLRRDVTDGVAALLDA